jgi:hypothetical protein
VWRPTGVPGWTVVAIWVWRVVRASWLACYFPGDQRRAETGDVDACGIDGRVHLGSRERVLAPRSGGPWFPGHAPSYSRAGVRCTVRGWPAFRRLPLRARRRRLRGADSPSRFRLLLQPQGGWRRPWNYRTGPAPRRIPKTPHVNPNKRCPGISGDLVSSGRLRRCQESSCAFVRSGDRRGSGRA